MSFLFQLLFAASCVVAAALLDNHNNIVKAVRNQPTLVQPTANSSASKNAATSKQANAFNEGDVLRRKIGGIKVLEQSIANSKKLYTLQKGR